MSKNNRWIFALPVLALIGSGMVLPATASAHEVLKEVRERVVRTTNHHGETKIRRHEVKRSHRADKHDRRRHQEHHDRPRFGHTQHPRHDHGRKYGHRHRHDRAEHRRYGYRPHRHERHIHRPVTQQRDRRHRNDGVRVRIDYDFWL